MMCSTKTSLVMCLALVMSACGDDTTTTDTPDASTDEPSDDTATDDEPTDTDDVPTDTDDAPTDTDDAPTDTDDAASDDAPTDTDDAPTDDAGPGDGGAPLSDGGGADAGDAMADEGGAPANTDGLLSIETGEFAMVAGAGDAGASEATGVAQMVRTASGDTIVDIAVTGLSPDTAYGAHVHALPCDVQTAGGHYQLDPSGTPGADNEIWPAFTTDADGNGLGSAIAVGHLARGDAQSVVVHAPGGTKILCADLGTGEEQVAFAGTFSAFAMADATEEGVSGEAMMVVDTDGTEIKLLVSGLDLDATYGAHVHSMPCDVGDANGHYKIDPSVATTEEVNELWPPIDIDGDGILESEMSSAHVARGDAQSIVIHRDGNKVLCANLEVEGWSDVETTGTAELLSAGADKGLDALDAEATLVRSLSGTTTASIVVGGLTPETEYPIHVHNLPCAVASGGGHYKLDPSVSEVVAENEIWLTLTTDASGAGEKTAVAQHLARPEAQSIVIHDGSDGSRLACIDLK